MMARIHFEHGEVIEYVTNCHSCLGRLMAISGIESPAPAVVWIRSAEGEIAVGLARERRGLIELFDRVQVDRCPERVHSPQ